MKTIWDFKKIKTALLYILFGVFFVLAAALTAVCTWYITTFDLEFKELLFTIASPLKGTGGATIDDIKAAVLPWAIAAALGYIFVVWKINGAEFDRKVAKRLVAVVCTVCLLASATYSVFAFRIPAYIQSITQKTTIYEDYYVDPDSVSITADGKTKNLIYIYLESMETTYASAKIKEDSTPFNYMPNLTALADQFVSFTDKEDGSIGGFHSPQGTGWTMAALLATTSGIPFSFPVGENGHNTMSQRETFASGLTNLGDILKDKGYDNYFLCGSDATFGGRRLYFDQHGDYNIMDLGTARVEGYVERNYYNNFWGYEDLYLYEIAKDKLKTIAQDKDQPFNFTMLTVDTHHVGGYRCKLCGRAYTEKLANVVTCADKQLQDFVDWCMEQDFMDDTVIVISGDHRRMDVRLVSGRAESERTIYNCFIGSDLQPTKEFGRTATSLDMFPTTLAALGFEIEGNRLGLGTNLFSDEQTLAEKIGYAVLDTEIQKFSDYYIREFS